jgi:hypothetical protein
VRDAGFSTWVKTIFDLRSSQERERYRSPSIPGATIHHVALLGDKEMSADDWAKQYRYYFIFYEESTAGFKFAHSHIMLNSFFAFNSVLNHICEHPDEPFLIHSTLGK